MVVQLLTPRIDFTTGSKTRSFISSPLFFMRLHFDICRTRVPAALDVLPPPRATFLIAWSFILDDGSRYLVSSTALIMPPN